MSQTGTRLLTLDKLRFAEAYPFIETMMHDHTNESLGRDALPDYTGFCSLCEAGNLRTYLAMNGDEPVGYCIMFVSVNLIHSDVTQAVQIGVYVKPAFRTGFGRWMISSIFLMWFFLSIMLSESGFSCFAISCASAHKASFSPSFHSLI